MSIDGVPLSDLARKGDRLIPRTVVEAKTGHSKATIWRLIAAGTFPKPVPFSANKRLWIEREVDDYVAGLIAKREVSA
jgi:predicted DNA-binding transcriptional regulator AlpA